MALICKYCLCEKDWMKGNIAKTAPPPSWMIEGELPLLPKSFGVCGCPCHWKDNNYYARRYLDAVREIYGYIKQ